MGRRKVLDRLLIIALLIVVLTEIAIIILNWQNIEINTYAIPAGIFTVNSTTGFILSILVIHNAYAKVIVTITNPSNKCTINDISW
ncbi:hypothetical protein JCM16161A_00590 [Vulcanisaeta sp. JCM 16161]|uniref:hypothetical protein n=1 Tax=Vulcanisaeta sp. JCM 16161 TaxID=1295372 RepID=UPI0006CF92E9|nr:hypothetical protein [Vulcanisaeta sp. JCM 16161]